MITIEDKLDMFRKLLFENIEKRSLEEREALTEKIEEEKLRLRKEAQESERQVLEAGIKKAETRKKQMISKAQNESYFKILKKKEELIEDIITELKKFCEKYVGSKEYAEFIMANLDKAIGSFDESSRVAIVMTSIDADRYGNEIIEYVKSKKAFKEVIIEKTDEEIIGGFFLEDKSRNIQIDYSVASLIMECRGLVGNIIGQKLDGVIQ